jgi:hypothetical protein
VSAALRSQAWFRAVARQVISDQKRILPFLSALLNLLMMKTDDLPRQAQDNV